MDPTASFVVFLLLLLAFGAGMFLPKTKPPKPPDHIHHVFDNRRD